MTQPVLLLDRDVVRNDEKRRTKKNVKGAPEDAHGAAAQYVYTCRNVGIKALLIYKNIDSSLP